MKLSSFVGGWKQEKRWNLFFCFFTEALKQIDSERLKAKRLEEQFKKKAKDFRMALLEILGFDFKQVQAELYQIKSGLAESRDDLFLFKVN